MIFFKDNIVFSINCKYHVLNSFFKTFILLLFSVNFLSILNAQVVQLGTGTAQTSATQSSPVNIYYRRFVSQFVYTSNEISAAGGIAGVIEQMGFFVTESPLYGIPDYTIKLKHVNNPNVANNLGNTGWTIVKNAFTYNPTSGGYDMIEFDTPFNWNGTSNIGVEICCSQVQPTWNASGRCRIYNANNGYRYSWTDAGGTSCGLTPGTRNANKPQCQLVIGGDTEWTGVIDTDWANPGNWTRGVPNEFMDANIPELVPNFPVLTSNGVCKSLNINANASVTIDGANELSVYQNWNNQGVFVANQSTVNFLGENLATINALNPQSFYNIRVLNLSGVSFNSGTFNIINNFYPEGGSVTTNNRITLVSDVNGTARITEILNNHFITVSLNGGWGDFVTWTLTDGNNNSILNGGTYGNSTSDIQTTVSTTPPYTFQINVGNNGFCDNDINYSVNINGNNLISGSTNAYHCGGSSGPIVANPTISNPFIGDITLQRYLSLSNDGWRELTSPITNQTLSNWQSNGVIMTNFTGSNFPNFGWTSVYAYNESNADGIKENGWVEATDISNPLSPFSAHRIYIGTGVQNLSSTGEFNVGDVNYNLGFENILPSELAANIDQKGWNLIGNPYPCTIDWDNIPAASKANIDDAIWIWSGEAGNYGMYVGGAGIGTNDVSNLIASSQGFWVHANNNNPSLLIQERNKVDVDKSFVKNNNDIQFFSLKLSNNFNSFTDEIAVTFGDNYTQDLDDYDGLKLFSPLNNAPSMYMITSNENVAINAVNFSEELHIPIVAKVNQQQDYILSVNHFEYTAYNCLILEDLNNNVNYVIDSTFQENFTLLANQTSPRFVLHIYPKISVEFTIPSCENTNDGAITITSAGVPPYLFELYDGDNNFFSQHTFDSIPYKIENLPGDFYKLTNVNNNYCSSNGINIDINPLPFEIITTTTQQPSCGTCDDGEITLGFENGTAPYTVYLNSNEVSALNDLTPGMYDIVVYDSNGCESNTSVELMSNSALSIEEENIDFNIFPNPVDDVLNIVTRKTNTEITITDILGHIIFQEKVIDHTTVINIQDWSAGTYFISLNGVGIKKFVKQ